MRSAVPHAQVCPHLRNLDLSHGPAVDDGTLEALWNRGTFWGNTRSVGTANLDSLSLAGCGNLSRDGMAW